MGDLIILSERRADRFRPDPRGATAFFYDLGCPFSYLAAEQVERWLGEVDWIPVASASEHSTTAEAHSATAEAQSATAEGSSLRMRRRAGHRAAQLRLPLVWPERVNAGVPSAMRAATYAAEIGAGARFGLAAIRLAFCGGFDLEDSEVLAEAAATVGIPPAECLAAAADPMLDQTLRATARALRLRHIQELPAVCCGKQWFQGEPALAHAAAVVMEGASAGFPLAPVS